MKSEITFTSWPEFRPCWAWEQSACNNYFYYRMAN